MSSVCKCGEDLKHEHVAAGELTRRNAHFSSSVTHCVVPRAVSIRYCSGVVTGCCVLKGFRFQRAEAVAARSEAAKLLLSFMLYKFTQAIDANEGVTSKSSGSRERMIQEEEVQA